MSWFLRDNREEQSTKNWGKNILEFSQMDTFCDSLNYPRPRLVSGARARRRATGSRTRLWFGVILSTVFIWKCQLCYNLITLQQFERWFKHDLLNWPLNFKLICIWLVGLLPTSAKISINFAVIHPCQERHEAEAVIGADVGGQWKQR